MPNPDPWPNSSLQLYFNLRGLGAHSAECPTMSFLFKKIRPFHYLSSASSGLRRRSQDAGYRTKSVIKSMEAGYCILPLVLHRATAVPRKCPGIRTRYPNGVGRTSAKREGEGKVNCHLAVFNIRSMTTVSTGSPSSELPWIYRGLEISLDRSQASESKMKPVK